MDGRTEYGSRGADRLAAGERAKIGYYHTTAEGHAMMNDCKKDSCHKFPTFELAYCIGRRKLLRSILGAASICLLKNNSAIAQAATTQASDLAQQYDNLYQSLLNDAELMQAVRGERERFEFSMTRALGPRPVPSNTPISQRASNLIVTFEVTNENLYNRDYHRPVWPFGQSGVTIGIGYDVGYVLKTHLVEDWREFIHVDMIERLTVACGKKGNPAKEILASLRDIQISWQTALSQYLKKTQPLIVSETEEALPNTKLLSPDSLGALVSLVYNRGASFRMPPASDPTGRFQEMRNIRTHMTEKEFGKIPGELRGMKRLWEGKPKMAGLLRRRNLEAALFEFGLAARS